MKCNLYGRAEARPSLRQKLSNKESTQLQVGVLIYDKLRFTGGPA